ASRFALARLAQAGVMALLAPLAALLAHQAGLSKRAAALAGLGISLYPILLFYPIGLASENLYIVLGMASLVAVLYCAEKRALGWTLLAGLLCGATMFTRSIFAIFVVLAGLWISHSSPRRIKAGLLFGLAAFGFCLPWSIRNSILMHRPAFVENSLGYNLFIGYHPQGDGGFVSKIAILPMNILDDGERERLCMQQAIQFIRQDPLEAARRIFTRLVKYLGPEDQEFFYFYSNDLVGAIPQPWLALLYLLLVIPWGCTLIFGTAGLWLLKDRRIVLPVALFLIGYGLPHLFIIADPRFHLAWIPVLAPFAAYGWEGRREIPWKRFLRKEDMVLATLLSLILFVLLFGLAANLPRLVAIMNQGGNQLYWSY
ncbi:MAG: hypothetical protein M1281_18230, partial [Chloroflexi bacterium]|nr:hypothetical protein [Chloroflexota bacterium]